MIKINNSDQGLAILHKLALRLGSIHDHDNDQNADIHAPVGCPIQSIIDLLEELQYLQQVGFAEPFILESYLEDQLKSMRYLSDKLTF